MTLLCQKKTKTQWKVYPRDSYDRRRGHKLFVSFASLSALASLSGVFDESVSIYVFQQVSFA